MRLVPLSELGAPQEYIPASSPRSGSAVQDGARRGPRTEEDGGGEAVDADLTDREVVADSRSDNDGGPGDTGEPDCAGTDARLATGLALKSTAIAAAVVASHAKTAAVCANAGGDTAVAGQEEATPTAPSTDEGLSPTGGEDGGAALAAASTDAAAAAHVSGAPQTAAGRAETAEKEVTAAATAYARASREFERLGVCVTPAEMLDVVKAGMTLLSEEAANISVSCCCGWAREGEQASSKGVRG